MWPFKRKKPRPADVRIAGIYTAAGRLGLGKTYRHENPRREFLVAMESGRDAVYRYADYEHASGCDWGWHVPRFTRYAKPSDLGLPRYT